jgi:DNA polymerase V
MASRSFGRPVETRQELEEAVATYTARAAEKMRRQALAATRLMVFVNTNRFRAEDPQHYAAQPVTLPVATADTGRLIGAAQRGLAAIYRPGFRYKKAGVVFLDLIPAAQAQGGLFDAPDDAASKARMRAVDALNRRYGRDTVTFAASGRRRGWRLRSAFLSPRYTTRCCRSDRAQPY